MKRSQWTIVDDIAISKLRSEPTASATGPSFADWIRILRNYLRMTQAELAKRSNISQSHLASIESGKVNPQISTLQQIYQGLSCDLIIQPRPQKPIDDILRGRARSLALKRLKQSMGSMSLEGQAPEKEAFRQLLEKRTDDILNDRRERLWHTKNE